MPKRAQRKLKPSRWLVMITRKRGLSDVWGFPVDSNESLILLHTFNSESFCLNGYDVIRQQDIRAIIVFDDPRYWRYRAIKRLKIKPTRPKGISIASMRDLLVSISRQYSLLSVHHETQDRHTVYVGPIMSLRDRTFTIEDLSYYGQWTGARQMRYSDVSMVCFDGGYLTANALTSAPIRRPNFDATK